MSIRPIDEELTRLHTPLAVTIDDDDMDNINVSWCVNHNHRRIALCWFLTWVFSWVIRLRWMASALPIVVASWYPAALQSQSCGSNYNHRQLRWAVPWALQVPTIHQLTQNTMHPRHTSLGPYRDHCQGIRPSVYQGHFLHLYRIHYRNSTHRWGYRLWRTNQAIHLINECIHRAMDGDRFCYWKGSVPFSSSCPISQASLFLHLWKAYVK